jgi:RNA polymerase sigma-70 factor (ECF subfamily)
MSHMAGPAERETTEEARWIARSAAGDKAAFGRLVERYQRFACSIVYRMTGQADLADDLAQEAFLRAWMALPRFRGESQFRTWLGRIVTNVSIDYLRSRRLDAALDERLPAPSEALPAQAVRAEMQEVVRRAILGLPAQSRAALVLREYEGLSYKEIAAVLDIPLGTVMSRLSYARNALRETLGPRLFPEGDEAESPGEHEGEAHTGQPVAGRLSG